MKNLILITIAILMIACTKKDEDEKPQFPNFLKGTKWLMLNGRDSFEFTADSMFMYQDMTDQGRGVGRRTYGYKFIEQDKIDMEEHYLITKDTVQDNSSANSFYPYIYYIKIEGSDLYTAINKDAYLLWGSRIN